jgi:hypothetical protein
MKISTAYDAFWFLREHPKMQCREAVLISPEDAKTVQLSKGERIRVVKDGMPWAKDKSYLLREFSLRRAAVNCNLDIFWAMVDKRGGINKDPTKNVFPECWLEFGEIKQTVLDGRLQVMHCHDIGLDCGAPTFDEAIIKLAKLVRKRYGDIKTPKWAKPFRKSGSPPVDTRATMR